MRRHLPLLISQTNISAFPSQPARTDFHLNLYLSLQWDTQWDVGFEDPISQTLLLVMKHETLKSELKIVHYLILYGYPSYRITITQYTLFACQHEFPVLKAMKASHFQVINVEHHLTFHSG